MNKNLKEVIMNLNQIIYSAGIFLTLYIFFSTILYIAITGYLVQDILFGNVNFFNLIVFIVMFLSTYFVIQMMGNEIAKKLECYKLKKIDISIEAFENYRDNGIFADKHIYDRFYLNKEYIEKDENSADIKYFVVDIDGNKHLITKDKFLYLQENKDSILYTDVNNPNELLIMN